MPRKPYGKGCNACILAWYLVHFEGFHDHAAMGSPAADATVHAR